MQKGKPLVQLDTIPAEEKEKLIQECKHDIDEIEQGLANDHSVTYKLATMQKQDVVILLAEQYEKLWKLGASDVPTYEIANHLVKRFEVLKLKVHPSTVYDNLPQKFKSHRPNPILGEETTTFGNPSENSSLNIKPEEENKQWLDIIESQIEFLRSFRTKLSNSAFTSRLPDESKKSLEETLSHIKATISICNQVFDDRQSVPVEFQHFLAASFSAETNNFAAGLYISQVKDYGATRSKESQAKLKKMAELGEKIEKEDTMTSKQGMKIILGIVKKVQPIFEPKNRNEALASGVYYGTQCPNPVCGSWRVYLDTDKGRTFCRCYACDTKFDAKTATRCKFCYLPFYDEVLREMAKTAEYIEESTVKVTCPNKKCDSRKNGQDIMMPIHLLHETEIKI